MNSNFWESSAGKIVHSASPNRFESSGSSMKPRTLPKKTDGMKAPRLSKDMLEINAVTVLSRSWISPAGEHNPVPLTGGPRGRKMVSRAPRRGYEIPFADRPAYGGVRESLVARSGPDLWSDYCNAERIRTSIGAATRRKIN
jgi:hypothetical protein